MYYEDKVLGRHENKHNSHLDSRRKVFLAYIIYSKYSRYTNNKKCLTYIIRILKSSSIICATCSLCQVNRRSCHNSIASLEFFKCQSVIYNEIHVGMKPYIWIWTNVQTYSRWIYSRYSSLNCISAFQVKASLFLKIYPVQLISSKIKTYLG